MNLDFFYKFGKVQNFEKVHDCKNFLNLKKFTNLTKNHHFFKMFIDLKEIIHEFEKDFTEFDFF